MQKEQTKLTTMSCPACGFQVFNRRYPRCERCASDLPASLIYSDQERRALLEAEEERLGMELKHRALQRSRTALRQRPSASGSGFPTPMPTNDSGTDGTISSSDSVISGGGGVFDGGGASGSFGEDSGCSTAQD